MSTKLEELKGEIASYKKKVKETAGKLESKGVRKGLKRLQRKYRKLLPKTDQDKLNESNKLLAVASARLGELQKITKRQGEAKMRSLQKKVKSLTRRVKILTAKVKPQEQPAQTPPAEVKPSEPKT